MKTLAVLMLAAVAACQPRGAAATSADSTAVMAAVEQYRQAWLQGDTAAALRWIADDIRILISGVPDIAGKAAARQLFLDEMATYNVPALTLTHQDVIVSGNHVIAIGIWEETQIPKAGGAPLTGRGRFISIWRREAGDWRIVRYMLNELPRS